MRDTGQGMFEGKGLQEVSREHNPERRGLGRVGERGSSGLGTGAEGVVQFCSICRPRSCTEAPQDRCFQS